MCIYVNQRTQQAVRLLKVNRDLSDVLDPLLDNGTLPERVYSVAFCSTFLGLHEDLDPDVEWMDEESATPCYGVVLYDVLKTPYNTIDVVPMQVWGPNNPNKIGVIGVKADGFNMADWYAEQIVDATNTYLQHGAWEAELYDSLEDCLQEQYMLGNMPVNPSKPQVEQVMDAVEEDCMLGLEGEWVLATLGE